MATKRNALRLERIRKNPCAFCLHGHACDFCPTWEKWRVAHSAPHSDRRVAHSAPVGSDSVAKTATPYDSSETANGYGD